MTPLEKLFDHGPKQAAITRPAMKERKTANPAVYKRYQYLDSQPVNKANVLDAISRKNGKNFAYKRSGQTNLLDGRLVKYNKGDLCEVTLEWCINTANISGGGFKLDARTIPTLALEANVSPEWLAVMLIQWFPGTPMAALAIDQYV